MQTKLELCACTHTCTHTKRLFISAFLFSDKVMASDDWRNESIYPEIYKEEKMTKGKKGKEKKDKYFSVILIWIYTCAFPYT